MKILNKLIGLSGAWGGIIGGSFFGARGAIAGFMLGLGVIWYCRKRQGIE